MLKAETKVGQLDQQITLQTVTKGTDSHGGPTEVFADLQTVWAKAEFSKTGSGEEYSGAVNLATNAVAFTVHYRLDINETSRVVWNGRNYDVTRIEDDGRRMFTVIRTHFKQ